MVCIFFYSFQALEIIIIIITNLKGLSSEENGTGHYPVRMTQKSR